ncbi:MAG: hypothetical protein H0W68_09545 [Gemmatimonadaceae bacterium]|nr:hypothetical protein [Gemmatimonadaceae bacterium]
MNDLVHVVLGAALVAIGVLAAALADRIRGVRLERAATPYANRAIAAASPVALTPRAATMSILSPVGPLPREDVPKLGRSRARRGESKPQDSSADDVIAALVAAGYKNPIATHATWACSAGERATIEDWAHAALRRCARGMS